MFLGRPGRQDLHLLQGQARSHHPQTNHLGHGPGKEGGGGGRGEEMLNEQAGYKSKFAGTKITLVLR